MPITKKYVKSWIAVLLPIISVAVYYSDKHDFSMINYLCVQGNSIFGFGFHSQYFVLCWTEVMALEVVIIWVSLLLMAFIIDLMTFPIRTLIKRKRNKVYVGENPFFK